MRGSIDRVCERALVKERTYTLTGGVDKIGEKVCEREYWWG